MISNLEKEITLRYLKTRKKDGFLNVITIFSFIGISLGVAVLIIVMSVMNGFRSDLIKKINGFNSHATIQSYNGQFNLSKIEFDKYNVHIHIPEGATPKDGPSAGITMLTSLVSLFSQKKVKKYLSMTGEITLRGKVLPVGGIKEKILAAKRSKIKEIILSEENKKDVELIPENYLQNLNFHYVSEMRDVIKLSVTDETVSNPKNI